MYIKKVLMSQGERGEFTIKVEAFDFQKYGTIEGAVKAINPYSLEENRKEKNADK
jgi:hypothetical protein